MTTILDSMTETCPKCRGKINSETSFCDEGKRECPAVLHNHFSCDRCSFQWKVLMTDAKLEPFAAQVKCLKCVNLDQSKTDLVFCETEHKGIEPFPHIHVKCETCKGHWLMSSAEIDIERQFDDLDKFVENCPKCMSSINLTLEYMEDNTDRKCKREHENMDIEGEHLHAGCGRCGFMWNSVTADFIEPKPKPKEIVEEPKPAPEARIAESA